MDTNDAVSLCISLKRPGFVPGFGLADDLSYFLSIYIEGKWICTINFLSSLLKVAKYQGFFFHFGSNLDMKVPNHCHEHLLFRKGAQGCDLAPFYGDWSQSEKLSEF